MITQNPQILVHENCLFWCPLVYQDVKGEWQNIDEEIKRSKSMRCTSCLRTGAAVGCVQRRCKTNLHYTCAVRDGRHSLDTEQFALTCSNCNDSSSGPREIKRRKTNDDAKSVVEATKVEDEITNRRLAPRRRRGS